MKYRVVVIVEEESQDMANQLVDVAMKKKYRRKRGPGIRGVER